jgi:hypothetical protein
VSQGDKQNKPAYFQLAEEAMHAIHFLTVIDPSDMDISIEIIGDDREAPLAEMRYAQPESVDWSARQHTTQMLHGYPVVVDTAPKKILRGGGRRTLHDLMNFYAIPFVSERFKDFVEQWEPGIHQFIPMEVYNSKEKPPISKHYWFNICSRVSSVNEQLTTYYKMPSHEETYRWTKYVWRNDQYESILNAKLVFDLKKTAGHHIWVDPTISSQSHAYCSPEFAAAAAASKFSGLSLTARETVA